MRDAAMRNKPTQDILLAENYQAGDSEEKAISANIGSAKKNDNGAISFEMRGGLAVARR